MGRDRPPRHVRQAEDFRLDQRGFAEGHGPLHQILEFTDVPGKVVVEKCRLRITRPAELPPLLLTEAPEKMFGQEEDILAALAQRRHLHTDYVEAVEEILPETPGLHFSRKSRLVAATILRRPRYP